jgi:hypothetical protein
VRENDGERIIRHWRFDIIHLQRRHHPKYVILALDLLLGVTGFAYERLAMQLT